MPIRHYVSAHLFRKFHPCPNPSESGPVSESKLITIPIAIPLPTPVQAPGRRGSFSGTQVRPRRRRDCVAKVLLSRSFLARASGPQFLQWYNGDRIVA